MIGDEYKQNKTFDNLRNNGYNNYKEILKSENINREKYSKVLKEDQSVLTKNFIENGGIIDTSEEAVRYLDMRKADGICFNNKLIFLRPDYSYSELIEELEHAKQFDNNKFNSDKIIELEIEAKTTTLSRLEKYNIPNIEIEDLKKQISYYKKLLKE